ncbi:hypothetical protein GH714_043995 [Hevea brasiliensis]|uniref:Uncharacterized protein n=1 Tax=Hevea brasiliensis TaxID=3981 RepID=A0A6A6K108_HEVBR|nr:hypothetical protein GH714_043995 [Hevea brasiliensis]
MSKVLPKFMSSSRMREEFGSIEMRLDKVESHLSREQATVDRIEDHLIRGDDRFEELGSRVSELGEGLEETRGEFQAALKETRDKLVSENEALKIAHAEEMSTMREDNRVLQERVEQLQEEVKQMREEMVLLRRLVTQESGANPHSTLSVPMARVVRPEPGASKGEGSAGKKDFHSRGEDRRASVESLPCGSLGAMGLVRPSEVPSSDGERDSGMVDAKIVSVLPRELPSEGEVDCVSESVAGCPRDVVLPKQERPRQRRSRRSRNRCKAERKAESPSHKDGKGTEAQKKAEGNGSHGHERGPRRRGKFRGRSDRGGHSWQLTDWVCQLAGLVANGLKLLDGKQTINRGRLVSGSATGSWGKRRGSLPRLHEIVALRGILACYLLMSVWVAVRFLEALCGWVIAVKVLVKLSVQVGCREPLVQGVVAVRSVGQLGQLGGTGHCHGPVGGSNWEALGTATGSSGATGRHWALPRARWGQLGGTGHCHGPIEGSNWEALGTATGPGANGRHLALSRARPGQLGGTWHCHGPVGGSNWEELGTATGSSGATGRHWALPRSRRGQLGGTGHCHGPVRGNWEALGTATGPSGATGRHWALPRARPGQLGGTGHCHGPIEGSNWEALVTATGPSGATGRHWALPRARRGSNWEALGTATGLFWTWERDGARHLTFNVSRLAALKVMGGILGRGLLEEPTSKDQKHVAMNAWLPQASYPCGNFSDTSSFKFRRSKGSIGHAFTVRIRTGNQNQTSFYPFVPHEISVLVELILGHLRYLLTDVPPQPNSPPDNVFRPDRPPWRPWVQKEGRGPLRFTE